MIVTAIKHIESDPRVESQPVRLASHQRRGSLLVELIMSTLLLIVAMSVTVRVLGWVAQERRSSEHRQRAVLDVANVMERLSAYEYDQVTTELARKLSTELSEDALPGGEWTASVVESTLEAGHRSKRVALRLRWRNRYQDWEAPVRLTTWIEPPRSEQ